MQRYVDILASGAWLPGSVRTVFQPVGTRKTDAGIEALVAERWARSEREAAQQGKLLFPGPLCRLTRHEASPDRLDLFLEPTDYREFLGTNMQWQAIEGRVGEAELPNYLSNALAVCAAVRTTDGKLAVGRRSQRVMEHPGRWHVPGGNVDPKSHVREGAVDVFRAMRAELEEELGCSPGRVALTCLSLVRPLDSRKPELLFLADVRYTWQELLDLPKDAEHDELVCVPDDPAEILAFLHKQADAFAPSGWAAFFRYGSYRYGPGWTSHLATPR